MSAPIEQRDAASLAGGYARSQRLVEIVGMAIFFSLLALLLVRVARNLEGHTGVVAFAVLLGYLSADFISGFVHWFCDTWGTVEWPIVGKAFIRTFREHHVDPLAITRHDFVETNGSNCSVSLVVLVPAMFLRIEPGASGALFTAAFVASLVFAVFLTSQCHKWSHQAQPPRVVAWLQRARLILHPDHHAVHHAAPFNRYYCITAGWLNAPLTFIGFFPLLERMITALTGALPRADDIGTKAALAVAVEDGVIEGESSAATDAVKLPLP
jgi:ubiquitin-conjugating enzyme E2 variant